MTGSVIVTGAAGGMGRACSRLLGASHRLVLADASAGALERFASELSDEGFIVEAAIAGDLRDRQVAASIAEHLGNSGQPWKLLHAAGLGGAQADWETILTVNLVATTQLLDALEPALVPGCAAVLIASGAGHAAGGSRQVDRLLNDALAADFVDRASRMFDAMIAAGHALPKHHLAYFYSKRGVHLQADQRVARWGRAGARINTVSPGLIVTPMSRAELEDNGTAEDSARVQEILATIPIARQGNPMDVALSARFLLSEDSGYVSGADLILDGGTIASRRAEGRAVFPVPKALAGQDF